LGSDREREKAPLADRCFPYFGFCMRKMVVECAALRDGILTGWER
jgi:hypothetical protein